MTRENLLAEAKGGITGSCSDPAPLDHRPRFTHPDTLELSAAEYMARTFHQSESVMRELSL